MQSQHHATMIARDFSLESHRWKELRVYRCGTGYTEYDSMPENIVIAPFMPVDCALAIPSTAIFTQPVYEIESDERRFINEIFCHTV